MPYKTNYTRVLLAENEKKAARLMKKNLERQGYSVDVALDAPSALFCSKKKSYNLIILDDAESFCTARFPLCSKLRAKKACPILMLITPDTIAGKVSGLKAGADDYLTKPFSFKLFLARVSSLIHRPA